MRCTDMYSYEVRITTATIVVTSTWKNTLNPSTRTILQKANPGYRA